MNVDFHQTQIESTHQAARRELIMKERVPAIERLKLLVPPPEHPVETGDAEAWFAVEKELGTELPEDYKEFINTYGSGEFDKWIWVYNPFATNQHINLIKQSKWDLEIYSEHQRDWPENEPPYPAHPASNGLLSWGGCGGGDTYFWQTSSLLAEWAVVLYAHEGAYERLCLTMTEFLARFFEGRLNTGITTGNSEELRRFRPAQK